MATLLRVNMSTLEITTEELPAKWKRYGGRALTDAIVYSEVPADTDPLGPGNKLVIAPGLFGGTTMPNAGRVSVGAKSPLTGGIKESNSGGNAANALARLGYAAVIIEGASADKDARYVLNISSDGSAKLDRRDGLAFKQVYETDRLVTEDFSEGMRVATMIAGPAAEYGSKAAGIAVGDRHGHPCRFAGRGGLGSVMASKGLKAVVIEDTGVPSRAPADKEAFMAASKRFATALREHPVTGQGLPSYGSNILMNILNEAGSLPTKNFRLGSFPEADSIGGETQRETILARSKEGEGDENATHGCSVGCMVRCSRYWVDEQGEYVTKGPEYESAWALGANCMIGDLDEIAALDRACGEIGIDTIEMGATLAVYMESGALEFGDAAGALAAIKAGLTDEKMRVIWDGADAVGAAFGVAHVPTVKGQSMPAYDPRAVQGIGVTYATTPMGADHTAGYTITANILGVGGTVDPLKTEGQIELSRNLQIATGMLDSFGLCLFVAFAVLDVPEAFAALHEMATAFTGDEWTADDLMELGKEVLTYERLFNAAAGFTADDDRLPEFAYGEALPEHDIVFMITDEELDSMFDFVPETAARMGL